MSDESRSTSARFGALVQHRHGALLAALVVWILSMTAVAVYFLGRRWLWFGAGTAAVVLGVHITLHWIAVGLGGASAVGFAARWLHGGGNEAEAPRTTGIVIHWAWRYDLLVWLISLGRERAMREKQLGAAQLRPGESVLDVGCGTGTLVIAAKGRVGPAARVCGIDASPEMIARARKKAARAHLDVEFQPAAVETLPFADASFDVVLATVMLHHLPDDARRGAIREIRRVLKPTGRLLAVDFAGTENERHTHTARRRNHADFDLMRVIPELKDSGFGAIESGVMNFRDLWFVRAAAAQT